jgi:acyl-CoA synthetase (AMP-forming)/AMP-acid ligase II
MSAGVGLFELLETRAREQPKGALCYRDGKPVSNGEAHGDALALAAGLRDRLGEGAVVAVSFEDPYELHRLIWGALAAGCCLAFLPSSTHAETVKGWMDEVGAVHLLTDVAGLLDLGFAFSMDEIVCDTMRKRLSGQVKIPGFLLRTSGTTGRGKWVAVSEHHYRAVLNAMRGTGALRHAEDQTVFLTPPLSHSYGLSALLEYVCAGSAVVFPRGDSPLGPAGELREEELAARITAIEGVSHFYGQLVRLLRRIRLGALRHIGFGGGAIDPGAVERLREAFPGLTCSVRYGLTETPSIVSGMVFAPPYEDDWTCSGPVLPVWDLRILDGEGQELGEGEEGEIHLRGPGLAWPYFGEPEAGDAFFPTGDLGFLRGGRLYIRGRKSFFLKRDGYRFSPEEVEAVIRRSPGVLDARVAMGEGGLTAEVVFEGEELPKQDLRTFVAEHLPAYAVPQVVRRVEEIPRTASGKILRHSGAVHKSTEGARSTS